MKKAENQRYAGIDCLKTVCAFLVICIHQPFPGMIGTYLSPLTRIAVPLFFMITGYFYDNVISKNEGLSQIHKIFLLMFKSNLFYFLLRLFYWIFKGESIKQSLSVCFTQQALLDFLLFNESPFYGHLWYLSASLYVLTIIRWTYKHNKIKYLCFITPFLLATNEILGNYSYVILNKTFPYIITRNFIFTGIPYFCIGYLLHQKCNFPEKTERIPQYKILISVVILSSAVLSLAEYQLLKVTNNFSTYEHYVSTPFLVISIFLYTLFPIRPKNNSLIKVLSKIGKQYSLIIYIVHPAIIMGLSIIISKISNYLPTIWKFYLPAAPVLIFSLSWLTAIILQQCKRNQYFAAS